MTVAKEVGKLIEIKLAEKIVENLDIDKIALALSSDIEDQIVAQTKEALGEQFDFGDMISDLLFHSDSEAAKEFKKTMEQLATKMAHSIVA